MSAHLAEQGKLNSLTATEMARRLARGETTSVDIVEACLARIAERNSTLRAWAYVDRNHALAQARARDAEPRRGPLHGVPVGIKDIFDTYDMPTAHGSQAFKSHRPAANSGIVGLMRRAGLIILGKCTTTEFATPIPAGVRNPRDLGRSPGVSSSGSAASVADCMTPLSLGSQTGGSTILPASFCGVFGFKASLTGLDRGGIRHLRPTVDSVGLFARDIDDIALLNAVLTGHGPPAPPNDVAGLRVGMCRTFNWSQAQPETVDALEINRELAARCRRNGSGCGAATGVRWHRKVVPDHRDRRRSSHDGERHPAARRFNESLAPGHVAHCTDNRHRPI